MDSKKKPSPDKRILLAEDDNVTASIVAKKLEQEGYQVQRTSDGEAALQAVVTGNFCLYIFDVGLPGLDGFGLLAQIKKSPNYRKTPVLMLTAMNTDADVRKGISLGADDYLIKPFLPYELAERVRRLLARKAVEG